MENPTLEDALKVATETHTIRIGENILEQEVSAIFKECFPSKKGVIIADTTTFKVAGKIVFDILSQERIEMDEPFLFSDKNLYAEYSLVDRLVDYLQKSEAIPIAVGSGTINDLTKLSSFLTQRRYMCVATAASMDGYTSFGASITFHGAKQTFSCPAPLACLIDTSIIAKAPKQMTASGFADLYAKITAGADWIIADELGIEAIDKQAWSIVQGGLKEALSNPKGAYNGEQQAITQLAKGLILGGLAMQWAQSSRPASGAEHQFSHLWNMEHHRFNDKLISHGFQVSIGLLAVTAFYEQVLQTPLELLDVEACCQAWPSIEEFGKKSEAMFANTDFPKIGYQETKAKYITRKELALELSTLKKDWFRIKERLKKQLIPYQEVKNHLQQVGAPTEPEEIGISRQRLRDSFIRAQYIRRRYTVLDLAIRTQNMDNWLNGLFAKGGIWEIN